MDLDDLIPATLRGLLLELIDGSSGDAAYIVNPGDRGLLGSLARLSAAEASAMPNGRSSVAAHAQHLRYGFELLNRWAGGENPFAEANYAASWQSQHVTDDEWQTLRRDLEREARAWTTAMDARREWDAVTLGAAIGSVAHLGYHLGAIRQVAAAAAGPAASD